MTVLVIGGGLVGSQIARILVEEGQRPVIMDRALNDVALAAILDPATVDVRRGDVLQPLTISEAIVAHRIDAIVHTAAFPMLTSGAQREPYAAIQLNIMGTVNVLEAARVHGVRRVVVSSSSVLNEFFAGGEAGGDISREEAFPRPTTFYAATKQAVESIGLNYAKHCGIELAAMRYGPVAGPWLGAGGGGPTNIFRDILQAALAGEEAVIPAAAFEWVYSKDAARASVLALQAASLGSRVFNVTMGRIVTPADFAAALAREFPGVKTRTAPSSIAGPVARKKPADITNARTVLGYEPLYPLEAAIRDYADWHRARGNAAEGPELSPG